MALRRRPGLHHRVRSLGIALLILSLAHAPMPQADFHNVRHHDAPGQVCEHHDHLLRWHPDASQADDVAVLHWHWLLPTSGPGESQRLGESIPKIHAHVDDWQGVTFDDGPQFVADAGSRPLVTAPAPMPLAFECAVVFRPLDLLRGLRAGPGPVHAFAATFTPHASMSSWLARWSC
jgi:hypothetical protein